MSQPPGQQPPQGEFGAPYGPPPEAFPPPAPASAPAPGHGAAQSPGPYGAPAQQPGPYGQPPQGYGYPPPQSPPQPPPRPGGPRGGGRFRGRTGVVVGVALAVALLAGGGIWFVADGDSEGGKPVAGAGHDSGQPNPSPSPSVDQGDGKGDGTDDGTVSPREEADDINARREQGEAKALWVQQGGVDLPEGGEDVYGPWIVGDTIVKAMFHTVSAYSVSDGTLKWSLRLPALPCGAPSQATADGRIVLGIRHSAAEDAACDSLQMIDLRTGRAGWRKSYDRHGIWDGLSELAMAINGDTVTVGRTSRTDAFRVSDGKALFGELPGNCQPFGFASGDVSISAASCQTAADDHKEHQVQKIDPVTGRRLWTYKVKKGWQVAQIYSADPVVISLKQSEEKWGVLVLNADGTYRTQLSGGPGDYAPQCDEELIVQGANLDNCVGVAADANTFYMATGPVDIKTGDGNRVAAFDLTTGKHRWTVDSPADQPFVPMRTEGGKLLMYVEAAKNKGGGIATLPPTGGTPRMVMRHPASGAVTERGFFDPRIAYVGGRTFLTQTRMSGMDDEEIETRSMVAFGS